MQDVDRAVLVHLLKRLRGMDASRVAMRNAREKSLNEREAAYRVNGKGLFFCIHDKHFFQPCLACKRSKRDADAKRESFINKCASKQQPA